MSAISLEKAIRTCKVDVGWDDRVQSDRFFNPNQMLCPVWNGTDSAGREVCVDSFVTKTAGCNSALDRVAVENNQRPKYTTYVTLDMNGVNADLYGDNMNWQNGMMATEELREDRKKYYGNFGLDMKSLSYPPCSAVPYQSVYGQNAWQNRENQALQEGFYSNRSRCRSGFCR